LDFDETYALVARLESIRILLAYATYHGFKLYQMEVNSAFLDGPIKEEVYVEQPLSFEDSEYPNHVYKLSKALYGLKQAPRAWYECLRDFLITNGFKVGKADPTLFIKTIAKDLFICQIYVDDIIFGSTNNSSCEEFSRIIVGGLCLSKVLKNMINIVSQVYYMHRNLRTWDKAVHNMKSMVGTKVEPALKLRSRKLRLNSRRGTDLKRKRLSSPR
jgi:hypothetical protein